MSAVDIARVMLIGDEVAPGFPAADVDAAIAGVDVSAIEAAERGRIEIADGWVYYDGRRAHDLGRDTLRDLVARATARRIAEQAAKLIEAVQ